MRALNKRPPWRRLQDRALPANGCATSGCDLAVSSVAKLQYVRGLGAVVGPKGAWVAGFVGQDGHILCISCLHHSCGLERAFCIRPGKGRIRRAGTEWPFREHPSTIFSRTSAGGWWCSGANGAFFAMCSLRWSWPRLPVLGWSVYSWPALVVLRCLSGRTRIVHLSNIRLKPSPSHPQCSPP